MKQSDVKIWKWNADSQFWHCCGQHQLFAKCGGTKMLLESCGPMGTDELMQLRVILDHYEKTGRLAPDEEWPSMGSIRTWLRLNGWKGHDTALPRHPTVALCIDMAASNESIVRAIAHATVNQFAAIRDEMLKL